MDREMIARACVAAPRKLRRLQRRAMRLLPHFPARRHAFVTAESGAIAWLYDHEAKSGGILCHSGNEHSYPEVTGYLVPTLFQYGETELAVRLVRWLISIQQADGSFTDPHHGEPYIFDTGQVLRGLLAGQGHVPEATEAARRAADYLMVRLVDGGRRGFEPEYENGRYHDIPESIHLYDLPPLVEASKALRNEEYGVAAERCANFYSAYSGALQIGTLTHYLAYQLEALIDMNRADLALPVLNELRRLQADDGAVRGEGGSRWVCTPGLAQLAICWYKLGDSDPADRALSWLDAHQESSGGLLGSYGRGAAYLPDNELSWAVKFHLDAHWLRTNAARDRRISVH